MGQWIDDYKKIRGINKVKDITIKPTDDGKLRIIFHHKNMEKRFEKIVDEAEITLRKMTLGKFTDELNAEVTIAEWWGDWGGPIKDHDALHVDIKNEKRKQKE